MSKNILKPFTAVVLLVMASMPVNAAGSTQSERAPVVAATRQSTAARVAVEAEMVRIARTSGGEVGVSARHLESGLTLSLNDRELFPMASTFKIAVAATLLAEVDAGRLSLEQMIPVDPALVLSSEGIAEIFPYPGYRLPCAICSRAC